MGRKSRHNPPYCGRLPVYRVGVDWGYLRGQHVTLIGTHYKHQRIRAARSTGSRPPAYHPYLQLRRTDAGYEGEVAPFNPRDWLEVHPAPAIDPPTA